MSNSQHPRALSVERWVGDSTRLLALVMLLPLVDGVFVAVVLSGALDSAVGIIEVGLLIFGGSALVAVILAEMDHPPRRAAAMVLGVGAILVPLAVLQAALAPTIESAVDMAIFERFAALVVLTVAASTASAKVAEYLPTPALVIALGFVATVSPGELTLAVQTDPELIARAAAAAGVGVGFGVALAAASPWLRDAVELDRFRFGSAVALGVLAVSIAGLLPLEAPVALLVLAITALLAFDPSGEADDDDSEATDDPPAVAADEGETGVPEPAAPVDRGPESLADADPPSPQLADGTDEMGLGQATADRGDGSPDDDIRPSDPTSGTHPGQDRPPWL